MGEAGTQAARDTRLFITLPCAKCRLRALVDTGACRSILSGDCWEDIGRYQCQEPRASQPLFSLTGEEIKSRGVVTVMLSGVPVEMYVLDNFHHDALLGVDALRDLEAQVDVARGRVVLNCRLRPHDPIPTALLYLRICIGEGISFCVFFSGNLRVFIIFLFMYFGCVLS